jgi:hypothetical protein
MTTATLDTIQARARPQDRRSCLQKCSHSNHFAGADGDHAGPGCHPRIRAGRTSGLERALAAAPALQHGRPAHVQAGWVVYHGPATGLALLTALPETTGDH